MNVNAKVKIHNRFDVHIDNIESGEHREVVGFNNVLDQMWTRLCGGSTYFVNIHFGTGTGTLDPTRNALFSHLGTKPAQDEELIKAIPLSTWKRKIVLAPEEFVDQTITEVGIAYGSTASYLVTHAMLKDAEGNQISITKKSTDVITIYATVFVTFDTSNVLWFKPESNAFINYLISGGGFPQKTIDLRPGVNARTALGSVSHTWTSDVPNKKRKTNLPRFGIDIGNGDVKAISYGDVFAVDIPIVGGFSGQPYTGVSIGTGDGVTATFMLPSKNIDLDSLLIKKDGISVAHEKIANNNSVNFCYNANTTVPTPYRVCMSHDGKKIATFKFQNLSVDIQELIDEVLEYTEVIDTQLYGSPSVCALNGDGTFLAVGFSTGKIVIYQFVGGIWEFHSEIDATTSNIRELTANVDCTILLASAETNSSTRLMSFDRVGTTWTQRAAPVSPPTGSINDLVLDLNNTTVVMAGESYPFFYSYDWNGSEWVKRPNPPTLVTSRAHRVASVLNGTLVGVGGYGSGQAYTYDWDGIAYTARPVQTAYTSGYVYGFQFSEDGMIMMITTHYSPFVLFFHWNGSNWVADATLSSTDRPGAYTEFAGLARLGSTAFACQNGQQPYVYNIAKNNTKIMLTEVPTVGAALTADYTVKGIHKTVNQIIDYSFSIQFGEGV